MSALLWKLYLEDDLDGFRQLLGGAGPPGRPYPQKGHSGGPDIHQWSSSLGSPRVTLLSPSGTPGSRLGVESASYSEWSGLSNDFRLTKADVNKTDGKGMTILHYAASSSEPTSISFALALIAHPLIDLYLQDYENGWTSLHRAFYFGNITIARAIIQRESEQIIEQAKSSFNASAIRLIKVKDHEGNGPYDLIAATIRDRDLHRRDDVVRIQADNADDEEGNMTESHNDLSKSRKCLVEPAVNVEGDELYTFGSNRNLTLGFGDQDDRQFPERPTIRRPDHLYTRFHREHVHEQASRASATSIAYSEKLLDSFRPVPDASLLPSVIKAHPIKIQDIQMSKFHTAVLTTDPISNLHICGHGPGGRLGTGDEKTRFNFVCIDDFGGAGRRRIATVALGQDHTLALTDQGEIFTWGSNVYGQLGLGMPKAKLKPEDAVQPVPKQLFGTLKREVILGVAASRFHSVAHTANDLFTWGKNEGQLGLVDAGARSLEVQATPRHVTPSRFSTTIEAVSAIEKATVCMLASHEIFVFANYGLVKLDFSLDGFASTFVQGSFLATMYNKEERRICKITCGGDTICGLSTAGEVHTVTVKQLQDPSSSSTSSTTNPNKIKAGLSTPVCVWSLRKHTMAARDVGVDQDGSIIITTESGGVWRRIQRPKASGPITNAKKAKDFKFSRVPNLTRVVAVRASSSGAYCAIRHDCHVTRTQVEPSGQRLWDDCFKLLVFSKLADMDDSDLPEPAPVFWNKPKKLEKLVRRIRQSQDLEGDIRACLQPAALLESASFDAVLTSSSSDLQLPVHQFILAARSSVLRSAFSKVRRGSAFENDMLSVNRGESGVVKVHLLGVDVLTLVEVLLYFYTDTFVGFWQFAKTAPALAHRYRQVRTELTKLAGRLDLVNLESAVRRIVSRADPCLDKDMELALSDSSFFENSTVVIQLKDGDEVLAHSALLARRCPYFEAMFEGAAQGQWLTQRRQAAGMSKMVEVSLDDIPLHVFKLVLRHLYADTGPELFDDTTSDSLDDFLDAVLEVQDAANFLMLDRLSEICQTVLGRYVTTRNASYLLNEVAQCSVTNFKDAALEYFCLNMEAMLANHLLDELDEDLMEDLDSAFRANQLDCLPFAKSGRAEADLLERHPELPEMIHRGRQAKLDAIELQSKLADPSIAFGRSIDTHDEDFFSSTPGKSKRRHRPSTGSSAAATPALRAQPSIAETTIEHDFALPSAAELSPVLAARKASAGTTHMSLPASMLSASTFSPSATLPSPKNPASPKPNDSHFGSQSREGTPSSPKPSDQPWGSTSIPTSKLDMRDIMNQATQARPSGIALGLQSQRSEEGQPAGSFHARVSQKERKRMQQQAQQQFNAPSLSPSFNMPSASPSTTSKSPWQTISHRPKPMATASADPLPGQDSISNRTPKTPHLTMRQTIANAPSTNKRKDSTPHAADKPPMTPQRSVSSPQATPISAQGITTSPHGSGSSSSKPTSIQSIRHTPSRAHAQKSSPSFLGQSLADIISHEQAEKTSIKEAAKSRSLLEIQQEQAFEEWWTAESKAVQEEVAQYSKPTNGKGRGGSSSGRGGRNRRRGGGNAGSTAAGGRGKGDAAARSG